MSPAVPHRLTWAVEQLPPRLRGPVLEIGCGGGQAVPGLLTRYPGVTVTAIDRSATQLARARDRLADVVGEGRVQLACVAFEHAAAVLDHGAFDLALAINVNAFWISPATAFEAARSLLTPGGRLVLVFEPPTAARLPSLAVELTTAMHAHGFGDLRTTRETDSAPLLCVQGVRSV